MTREAEASDRRLAHDTFSTRVAAPWQETLSTAAATTRSYRSSNNGEGVDISSNKRRVWRVSGNGANVTAGISLNESERNAGVFGLRVAYRKIRLLS
jgi:hypothetical protein